MQNLCVPHDNNQAKSDLHMMEVQQKISGTFRSWHGAEDFTAVRSYLSTLRKRKMNLIGAIASVFFGAPMVASTAQES